jgi:hypothetical protein
LSEKICGETSDSDIPLSTKRLAFVGLTNRECLLSEIIAEEQIFSGVPNGAVVAMDAIAGHKIDLVAGAFSPDEIAESAIDATEALLRMLLQTPESPSSPKEISWDAVAADVNIAIAYQNTEALWMDVVWHQYRMMHLEEMGFASLDPDDEKFRVVAFYRHLMTSAQRRHIKELQGLEASGLFSNPSAAEGSGKSSTLNGASHDLELERFILSRKAQRAASVPTYYANKAVEAGPLYPLLTLQTVMDGYDLLSVLIERGCREQINSLKCEREGTGPLVSPLTFASLWPRDKLLGLFAESLAISNDIANELLEFFTLGQQRQDGKSKYFDDLWSAPCVDVDEGHIALTTHPPRGANFNRLVDIWLRRLGFALDFKGTEFEEFARNSLMDVCENSTLSGCASIFPGGFKFVTAEGREEEIDLLMIIGDYVVVGELKCFLAPTAPLDWANHREKCNDAATQVARKAAAIVGSSKEFQDRAAQLGVALPAQYRTIPVVVLNHAIGAGQTISNVPIVDLRIVEMFYEGQITRNAILSPDGTIARSVADRFYTTHIEAIEAFEAYLAKPPQLQHLRSAVKPRFVATMAWRDAPPLFKAYKYEVDVAVLLADVPTEMGGSA